MAVLVWASTLWWIAIALVVLALVILVGSGRLPARRGLPRWRR